MLRLFRRPRAGIRSSAWSRRQSSQRANRTLRVQQAAESVGVVGPHRLREFFFRRECIFFGWSSVGGAGRSPCGMGQEHPCRCISKNPRINLALLFVVRIVPIPFRFVRFWTPATRYYRSLFKGSHISTRPRPVTELKFSPYSSKFGASSTSRPDSGSHLLQIVVHVLRIVEM